MKQELGFKPTPADVGIYECELRLKFRMIEEHEMMRLDREQLLELLVDALACGADEYLETLETDASVQAVPEMEASPQMRRQLIRLRNSKEFT
jgi:hypothetical protein